METQDNPKWDKHTFETYHNDQNKFVKEVLKFFFVIIDSADADKANENDEIYYRDDIIYRLKPNLSEDYKRFTNYYRGEKKLYSLFNYMQLVWYYRD